MPFVFFKFKQTLGKMRESKGNRGREKKSVEVEQRAPRVTMWATRIPSINMRIETARVTIVGD